ncbi:hypothetical protein Vafri_14735, partial [Volvox africanus]
MANAQLRRPQSGGHVALGRFQSTGGIVLPTRPASLQAGVLMFVRPILCPLRSGDLCSGSSSSGWEGMTPLMRPLPGGATVRRGGPGAASTRTRRLRMAAASSWLGGGAKLPMRPPIRTVAFKASSNEDAALSAGAVAGRSALGGGAVEAITTDAVAGSGSGGDNDTRKTVVNGTGDSTSSTNNGQAAEASQSRNGGSSVGTTRCRVVVPEYPAVPLTSDPWVSQRLLLVGSCRELGEWDPGRALVLERAEAGGWTADVELNLQADVAAKLLIVRGDGAERSVEWEKGGNRTLLPYAGNKALLMECPWSQPERTTRLEIDSSQLPPLRLLGKATQVAAAPPPKSQSQSSREAPGHGAGGGGAAAAATAGAPLGVGTAAAGGGATKAATGRPSIPSVQVRTNELQKVRQMISTKIGELEGRSESLSSASKVSTSSVPQQQQQATGAAAA